MDSVGQIIFSPQLPSSKIDFILFPRKGRKIEVSCRASCKGRLNMVNPNAAYVGAELLSTSCENCE